jgi:hypothetical protein
MQIISALTSPHQDETIEKILRHRQQWHPPPPIGRKARGPPTLTSSSSTTTLTERLLLRGPLAKILIGKLR